MSRGKRVAIFGAVIGMLLLMAGLPYILLTLPNPEPLPYQTPGAGGRGVYVQDAKAAFKLFPTPQLPDSWPKTAFVTDGSARVFVASRQYDVLPEYGIYSYPGARPLKVAKEMVAGHLLRLTPASPLSPGRYIVQVSRDDAEGGSDYYFLQVRR